MRIKILSLGCRLNQSEIQSVASELESAGHEVCQEGPAHVVIVNSCMVTGLSERKTRKALSAARRETAAGGKVILTGCMAEGMKQEEGVYTVSNDYKYLIPKIIEEIKLTEVRQNRFGYRGLPNALRTRANLKIQDGCNQFCSYCIVPFRRGPSISKDFQETVEEFRELIACGAKEVVFTGVMVGRYASGGKTLPDLLESLLSQPGEFRLHLASFSPDLVEDRLIELFCHEKMVKHFNLSLQSGSDRILKRMNRAYTAGDYLKTVEKIRKKIPLFNLTTDLIQGFPGETEEDFELTLKLMQQAEFSHVHAFRYSPRRGTAAAQFKDPVPEPVKALRNQRVIELSQILKQNFYQRFQGQRAVFLPEGGRSTESHAQGFTQYYLPVKVTQFLPANHFVPVTLSFTPGSDVFQGLI